jgi:hypothetical protein
MDYLIAVHQVTDELRHPAPGDLPAQAAIELVVHVWPHLASTDPTWDLLAIDLLAVRDTLYPDRAPLTTAVEPPTRDTRAVRDVVSRLLLALAELYERATDDGAIDHTRRLQFAAAAIQVRRAARNLT